MLVERVEKVTFWWGVGTKESKIKRRKSKMLVEWEKVPFWWGVGTKEGNSVGCFGKG